jgi:hypothetical protein
LRRAGQSANPPLDPLLSRATTPALVGQERGAGVRRFDNTAEQDDRCEEEALHT